MRRAKEEEEAQQCSFSPSIKTHTQNNESKDTDNSQSFNRLYSDAKRYETNRRVREEESYKDLTFMPQINSRERNKSPEESFQVCSFSSSI